ncbi:MAG: hypothetical protein ABI567_07530, partial [Gammaproteobacteria bacterium]
MNVTVSGKSIVHGLPEQTAGLNGVNNRTWAAKLAIFVSGDSKTFTACTLSYRLLAHAGFK